MVSEAKAATATAAADGPGPGAEGAGGGAEGSGQGSGQGGGEGRDAPSAPGAPGAPGGAPPSLRGAAGTDGAALTASEARRQRKEQRREERREFMKEQRREKKKAKQQRKLEARRETLEAMGTEEREAFLESKKAEVTQRRLDDKASLQRAFDEGMPKVVINCSFGDTMDYKEQTSLAKQAQMAYTAVRDLRSPVQLHLASVNAENPAMRAFENIGLRGWIIHVHEKCVWDVFPADKLVVLSPDAEEDLEDVQEDKVYVIGGIVDRSVSKMQSYDQAQQHGAACLRRLPIKKHGPRGAHPVLNIDTVVRILAERLRRGDDWPGVLEECLPYRYSGQPTARMLRNQRKRERKLAAQGGEAAGGDSCDDDDDDDGDDSDGSCSSEGGASSRDGGGAGQAATPTRSAPENVVPAAMEATSTEKPAAS